jgi:hypothetical protein
MVAALVPLLPKHVVHMYQGQHSLPQWQLLCRVHTLHGIAAAFPGVLLLLLLPLLLLLLLLLLQTAHWHVYCCCCSSRSSTKP